MTASSRPAPLQSAAFDAPHSNVALHGFFTREGGVSAGIYEGLNVGLGSDDASENVAENRNRVAAWFAQPIANLVTVYQVHSADAVHVTEPFPGDRPQADAMVTATPGIMLGVLTADCGPVLFSDPEHGVIGAAHAGWKGALTGVLENTIEAMITLGAKRGSITAVLGPSISAASYEVGPEFVTRFLDQNEEYSRYFSPSPKAGHAMFNLPALTVKRLADAGVKASSTGHCTYRDEQRFYSYRRTTHRGELDYGRQISAIMLK